MELYKILMLHKMLEAILLIAMRADVQMFIPEEELAITTRHDETPFEPDLRQRLLLHALSPNLWPGGLLYSLILFHSSTKP